MADKPQLETFVHQNVADRGVHVGVKLNLDQMANSYFPEMFLREAAKAVADRYVAEHYQEIVALIDQKAIATLSVAEGAAAIRESLEKDIPHRVETIVRENTKREVYQRGLLGGLKRIL